MRIYPALVLNDYEHAQYAEWVKTGKKTIETRMKRLFKHRGDIVICCGKSKSVGPNAGKALCIVNMWEGREMKNTPEEIAAACIEWHPDRKSLLLKDWRHFSRDFEFAPEHVSGSYQAIFTIMIPDDVKIIARPDILPFTETP